MEEFPAHFKNHKNVKDAIFAHDLALFRKYVYKKYTRAIQREQYEFEFTVCGFLKLQKISKAPSVLELLKVIITELLKRFGYIFMYHKGVSVVTIVKSKSYANDSPNVVYAIRI